MCIDCGYSEGYSGQQKRKERVSSLRPFELAMDSGYTLTDWEQSKHIVETKPFQYWGVSGRDFCHSDLPNLVSYSECKKRAANSAAVGDSSFSVHIG
jgi:hypothetical protein